jgi:uncharacterized protein (TIGR03435 family)
MTCGVVAAQSPPDGAASLSFEVASIRRNVDDEPGYIRVEPGARFVAVSATPMLLIRQAYGVLPLQLENVPDWVEREHYDVIAKPPDGVEVAPNMAALLRSLLRDRFGFQAHADTRNLPIYELVTVRDDRRLGPQLRPAAFDCAARKPGAPSPLDAKGESLCGITVGPNRVIVRGYPLSRFAASLTSPLQRIVVDRTGLSGPWNIDLRFTPDQPVALSGVIAPTDPNVPRLVTAVQEQLGLRLEPSRGPVDVLVIDRISRPTTD